MVLGFTAVDKEIELFLYSKDHVTGMGVEIKYETLPFTVVVGLASNLSKYFYIYPQIVKIIYVGNCLG